MSVTESLSHFKPEIQSTNKFGRSNRCHFLRQNHRKKTSIDFEKKFKHIKLSRFSADQWIPCKSGFTRGQGWNCLFCAWIGFKRANNPKNGESFQDRLYWATLIQNLQTDLGLQRSSFPQLGLLGDVVFLYDKEKELELHDQEDELLLEEYKKEKRTHIKEIVHSSMLSEQEREWMTEKTYENENRYIERIIMPNFFDMRRNSHI
jgi:hypothetical protein